jgi:hypothetical protein
MVMRGDFSDGRTVPADEAIEQLLRLASNLPEIRMWRKRASRKGPCGHDELFPATACAVTEAPGVRSLGQKRVHRRIGL